MKPNIGYYVQNINDIIKEIEEIGETMDPFYEEIRSAIDNKELHTLTTEKLQGIHDFFEKGSKQYHILLKRAIALKSPARVIGIHKKFEKAFTEYTEGCDEMIASIHPEKGLVDTELFNRSDLKQDLATDTITFCIQRITNLLLK